MDQHYQTASNPMTTIAVAPAEARVVGRDTWSAGAGAVAVGSVDSLRSAVAEIFRALNETLRDRRSDAAQCLRRAGEQLAAMERQAAPPPVARRGLAPWQVRRVQAYVDANLDKPLRNRELAAIARLSEFHFNVAFRNSVGDSPHEYVIRRRIERAQGIMLSTDAPLSEIAIDCGLADQAHFTRLFRRIVGETPAAWRRARVNPA